MGSKVAIGITIEQDILVAIDIYTREKGHKYRSNAIEELLRAVLEIEQPQLDDKPLKEIKGKLVKAQLDVAQLKEQETKLEKQMKEKEQKKLKKPYLATLKDEQMARALKEQAKRPKIKFTAKDKEKAKKSKELIL